jgi:cytoskeletal protein CcmA (bactofilin family)
MFKRKSDKLDLILGENSKITGDVESAGTILVDGIIIGSIHGEKVILSEKSYVKGDILANSISTAGKTEGRLKGIKSIEVKSTGHISGDIITRKLSITGGAVFNGMAFMDDADQDQKETDKKVVEFAAKER